jgi:hypothetical protein
MPEETIAQPVSIPGAAKGTPLPVEAKPEEPIKPRSTPESIRAACMANKAAAKQNSLKKSEGK